MDNREFFNKLAFKWDEICDHNEEKINKIIELSDVKVNSNILDVGTGTGVLIKYILQTNPLNVKAIDVAENMISLAKKKYNDERVEFIVGDVLKYNKHSFDYIFLYSVYPHFSDKEALFSHLSLILNENGKIIIAHSQSKEKINEVHRENKKTENDRLQSAEITANIMSKYFNINKIIDNDQMYYVSAVKKMQ